MKKKKLHLILENENLEFKTGAGWRKMGSEMKNSDTRKKKSKESKSLEKSKIYDGRRLEENGAG